MIWGRRTCEGGGNFHGKEGRVLHRHTLLEHGMLDLMVWREALQVLPSDSVISVERVGIFGDERRGYHCNAGFRKCMRWREC